MSNDKIIVNISIRDKRAYGDGTVFVCDNSDYVLHFDFDEQWDGVEAKTARIIYSGSKYIDIPFRGNQVKIERTPVSNRYSIGVYASNIKTSTPAFFDCDYSILSTNPFHAPIPEDTYNKIMALIEGADDAIVEVDELPTENIDPHILYNVKGKLFYRVGDAWAEITTDFFDYVKRGEYEEAMQSLTESITEINEGVDGKLTAMGESLKATDDKAVVAHNKAVEVNTIANNALGISTIALENTRDFGERLNETDEAIETLQGTGEGSVVKAVADALAKLVADAPESLNTLKEISDWITEHTDDASAMNSEILKLRDEIDNAIKSIDFSAYVKSTDYATADKAGVVKVYGPEGWIQPFYRDADGMLNLGNDSDLIKQRNAGRAIRNEDLDLAVIEGITNNGRLLTEDEKAKATAWLGAVRPTDLFNGVSREEFDREIKKLSDDISALDKTVGDIESALDSIIEIQNSLIGGEAG